MADKNDTHIPSFLPFSVAASIWLKSRAISKSTEKHYRGRIKALNRWFRDTPLEKIHIGMLICYQEARVHVDAPFISPASPRRVNLELGLLKTIMRHAGCRDEEMEQAYRPLDTRPVYRYEISPPSSWLARIRPSSWVMTAEDQKQAREARMTRLALKVPSFPGSKNNGGAA
jgi:hypothetical protein